MTKTLTKEQYIELLIDGFDKEFLDSHYEIVDIGEANVQANEPELTEEEKAAQELANQAVEAFLANPDLERVFDAVWKQAHFNGKRTTKSGRQKKVVSYFGPKNKSFILTRER